MTDPHPAAKAARDSGLTNRELADAAPFAVLVCDGCGIGAPPGGSVNEVRSLAQAHGWAVNMGPESEDFCSDCADEREIPVDP